MGDSSDEPNLLDRINSWAKAHAGNRSALSGDAQRSILPLTNTPSTQSGSSRSTTKEPKSDRSHNGKSSKSSITRNAPDDGSGGVNPINTEDGGAKTSSIGNEKLKENKSNPNDPWSLRMKKGTKRFWAHTKHALFYSWVNVLLIFVPIGIVAEAVHLRPEIIFAMNAIAIIPLAGLLSHATESVASRLGDTLGALLNVSFGNAVELIIFIALVKNEIRIVQASLLGSILANLLLILGMAFLLGGLRFREQIYNSTVTQMSACLLSLSVTSLLLPTAFHASWSDDDTADRYTLKISRGTSVVLLLVYILYLLFQLKSHAYLYESTPQDIIDEESHPGVLADMLNSSSSSSSSDSSSSDSDSSSGSHTTAKRIKRAFRNRKRRKSSASSKDTPSIRSGGSPPGEGQDGSQSRKPPESSAPRMALGAILSGDEADTDGERDKHLADPITGEGSKQSYKKHSKKRGDKRKSKETKDALPAEALPAEANDESHGPSEPRVGFSDNIEVVPSQSGTKRPFGIRQISTRPLRPALPTVFTNNVFSNPQPNVPATTAGPSTLRRTTSLPDRLNRTQYGGTRASKSPIPPLAIRNTPPETAAAGEEEEEEPAMSRTAAVVMLLASTALVAVCAEFLVDSIPAMIESSPISQAFIGLIILPIVGNAAEHVTAVTVAAKNKMDLAIGVAVGSSIQIAIFVTPLVVILGWCMDKEMTLYFNLFETISLFVTAFVVNFLVLDGRSNYLEGALLIAAYVIIAVAAFYYPDGSDQSTLGGNGSVNKRWLGAF